MVQPVFCIVDTGSCFILALALFLGRAVIGDFPMFDSGYCDLTRTLLSFYNLKKMLQYSFMSAAKYCIQFQETGAAHVTSALANPDVTIFMWHTFIHQIQK